MVNLIAGDLITKKPGDNIDGYPLLIGIYTLLRQSKTESVENFINFLCKYAKVVTMNRLVLHLFTLYFVICSALQHMCVCVGMCWGFF